MNHLILTRTLWYEQKNEILKVDQSFLTAELNSLVVLGEAGMGKSTLLGALRGKPGYAVCTARQLINRDDPKTLLTSATTLVVDALDEVSARSEGDAVDLVVRKLGQLGYPRFILSCRVADWRSATALQGIADHYEARPLELHLNPLGRDDAVAFLSQAIGAEKSEAAIAHFEERGLDGLWSNPQTLDLIEQVATFGHLPNSKGDLFEQAIRLLRVEHREEKSTTPLVGLPEAEVLDAAGAAFAAIILSGADSVSRKAQIAGDDLALAEISTLPGAVRLGNVLGARLFEARGAERFTYAHRAIGEFLGARWLTRQATTARVQRRLLALFQSQPLIPASLRGIHAWLAWHSSAMALAVITADPMGVIEYGDADNLSVEQGKALLTALGKLSEENPRFREWGPYRVGGIAQKALLPEIRSLLTAPKTAFGLRLLILQALKNSSIAVELADTLRTLLLDRDAIFANRSEAGDRLAALGETIDWPGIVHALLAQADENGGRLAMEMAGEVGYEHFDDELLIDAIFAQIDRSDHTVGVFHRFQLKVPDTRLDGLIDLLTARAATLGKSHVRPRGDQLTDLAYGLIARRLKVGSVDAKRLWRWLQPFDNQYGYHRESREEIAQAFRDDNNLRRAIQRHVLFDAIDEKTVWERAWRLSKRSFGLAPTAADVLSLLDALDPNNRQDERWRDVLRLTRHSESEGADVRASARRFAAHRPDMLAWIDQLAVPRDHEWQKKQEEESRKSRARRAVEWAGHRADFAQHIAEIRRGDYGYLANPAKAYLKLFRDVGDGADDGPGRLIEWLGPELGGACLEGFEAFLMLVPPRPTAQDISESHADGRGWPAAYIIVAALAERLRNKIGFRDLINERLMAGLFQLFQTRIDNHAAIVGLEEALTEALRERGAWETTMRLYCEPQFVHKLAFVDRLYSLMREDKDAALATKLAAEWLTAYADMPEGPETELIDRLLRADRRAELRTIQQARFAHSSLNDERRRTWQAVSLIVNFESAREQLLALGPIEPELLWHLRARLGARWRDGYVGHLEAAQLNWVISTFRPLFPVHQRPDGVTTGDTNPWDAMEYINTLIGRLGGETSNEAIAAVTQLRDAPPDGYNEYLRVVAAEQRRNRIEVEFHPPTLANIAATVTDEAPADAVQLQTVIAEELAVVQAKLRGSDVDWYADFTDDSGSPRVEDDCRDAIIKMLRPLPFGIIDSPEGHVADDKRCDIICLLGNLMVPIEVKGQWHPELWSAADRQLDRLYVNDWRAERGIYLVLWFGPGTNKPLKAPSGGVAPPATAEDLRDALKKSSDSAQSRRLEIIVLDLTRPGS